MHDLLHRARRHGALALALFLFLAAAGAAAQQPTPKASEPAVAISDAEFEGVIDKTLNVTTPRGTQVALRLEKGGRSVVSKGFNDVGRWRPNGPGAYCIRWNKLPMEDRCATVVRRDGGLAILQADGQLVAIHSVE